MSEKTEQPTSRRREEAERRGQVAQSRLWTAGAPAVAALATLALTLPRGAAQLSEWTKHVFSAPELTAQAALSQAGCVVATLAGAPILAAFATSLVAGFSLSGFRFRLERALPKWERLSPTSGWKRLLSRRSLSEAIKALAAGLAVMTVAVLCARGLAEAGLGAVRRDGLQGALVALFSARAVALRCAAALLCLAALDFLLARRRHAKELMMTRAEIKREHREAEGDPRHKQHRRALHRELVAGGPARGVRSATAVVVNPTHIAVALRYSADECPAPYLVAKGREADAFAIRREAEQLRIPIIRDIPLARSLVQFDVGMEIPEELYQAAAAVLRVAMEPEAQRGTSPAQ